MANGKTGGLVNRLLLGKEKSEGYARASLPSNRWELFWDIFKGRFWKLVVINILTLLFCIPLFAIVVLRLMMLSGSGAAMPVTQGFGVGYGAPYSFTGLAEQAAFSVNVVSLVFLPIAMIIAAVGLSGATYVIRNMVWTEGIFVANDFWRGVKQNIKQLIAIAVLYSVLFYIIQLTVSLSDYYLAVGGERRWVFVLSKILSYSFLVYFTLMTLHMVSMSVTYEYKFLSLIRNSFLFTLGLFPHTIVFAAAGIVPFLPMFIGGFFMPIGVILILLLGVSFFLLVWTVFCQWAYDKFINDRVPGAKKNRGIYEKVKESNSEALRQYRQQVAMARTSLNSRPIKPITDDELKIEELPAAFNRDDIIKLQESKERLYEDNAKYIEEHKNDPEFLPTEEEKAARKAEEERERRIAAAKKELEKRNKNRKNR
ncbi:MAG: hypothetical protein IK147_03200 [Clostridia bacterium]|nr:hypothetical protein [Clostridia bacterium]